MLRWQLHPRQLDCTRTATRSLPTLNDIPLLLALKKGGFGSQPIVPNALLELSSQSTLHIPSFWTPEDPGFPRLPGGRIPFVKHDCLPQGLHAGRLLCRVDDKDPTTACTDKDAAAVAP